MPLDRWVIDGHKVTVTDDGRLFVQDEEYTDEFDGEPVGPLVAHQAVELHKERHA